MIPVQKDPARGEGALVLALGASLALLLWTAQRTLGAAVLFVASWILGSALPAGPARRAARALLIAVLVLWILHQARWGGYPLVAGLLTAFVLAPTVAGLTRRGFRRPLAIALCLLPIGLLAGLALVLLIPALARQIEFIISRLPAMYAYVSDHLDALREVAGPVAPFVERTAAPDRIGVAAGMDSLAAGMDSLAASGGAGDGTSLIGQLVGQAENLLRAALGRLSDLGRGIGRAAQWLGLLLLTPIVAWHLLADQERLRGTLMDWVPARWQSLVERLSQDLQSALRVYVRGQVLVALVEAVLFSIVFAIAGLPQPIALGLLAGLFSLIPIVGFGLTIVLVALNTLTGPAPWASLIKAAIGLTVINVLEGQFLVPRIQGTGLGIHPLAVLLGVLLFGTLFGFAGMLLAVPAMGVLRGLLPAFLEAWRASSSYRGDEVCSDPGEEPRAPGAR